MEGWQQGLMKRSCTAVKRTVAHDVAQPIAKRSKTAQAACDADSDLKHHEDYPHDIRGIQVKWRALLKLSRPLEQGEAEQRFCGSSSEAFSASASGSAHPCFPADCPEAAPRRSTPAVFVPSQGRAFATIVEALKHARSGDVITLQPGSYAQNSPIVLEHDGVTIVAARYDEIKQGVARPAQVIIISHTHGQDSVVCRARACEVRGIVFEHFSCSPRSGDAHSKSDTPPHLNGCIKIESGDVHIVHCSITSQSGYGIKVMGSSSPCIEACALSQCHEAAVLLMDSSCATLSGCHLSRNMCAGIVMLDASAGCISGNTITHNEKCGIVCAGRSSARVCGNTVMGGNGGGVWIRERSCVVLEENLIALSLKVSLQVSDDSTPTVHKNRIINGCNGGIVVHGAARGFFSDNVITGHNKAGLGVTDSARPHFVGNSICSNRAGGAILTGHSVSEWHENVVNDNILFGMHVRGNAALFALAGSASHNCGPGLQLQEGGHAEVLDVCFDDNARAGAIAVGNASLKLSNCRVRSEAPRCASADGEHAVHHASADSHMPSTHGHGGGGAVATNAAQEKCSKQQRIGVHVAGHARVEIVSCQVQGHTSGNVAVQGCSVCTIKDSTITGGTWAGIVLQGTSKTVLTRVDVGQVRSAGVLCMDQAVLTADSSKFSDCKGVGILLAGSTRALLMRNAIVGNVGTGLVIKETASVDMRRNRVSGNGLHGVTIEGACALTASENVIFENGGAGIQTVQVSTASCGAEECTSAVPELIAFANILMSSSKAASVAAALDGSVRGLVAGNMLDSWRHTPYEDLNNLDSEDGQDEGDQDEGDQDEGDDVDHDYDVRHDDARQLTHGIGSVHQGPNDARHAVDLSSMPGLVAHLGAVDAAHEMFGDNATVERAELVALLRNELLPLDYYGPAPDRPTQIVAMPDGSSALILGWSDSPL